MAKFDYMTNDELLDYASIESDDPEDLYELEEIANTLKDRAKKAKDKKRSMPFDIYFGEMDLTENQKDNRKELAKKLEAVMEIAIALIVMQEQYNISNELMTVNQLSSDYYRVASEYTDEADYEWLSDYSQRFASDFVSATDFSDKWFTSQDRATFNAENEANTILNRKEFREAKNRGLGHKEWLTMEDSKVRPTHKKVDREIIPIDAFFEVGNALMLYPKDVENASDHPEEIVGCRCGARYTR